MPTSPITLKVLRTEDKRICRTYFIVVNEQWEIDFIDLFTQTIKVYFKSSAIDRALSSMGDEMTPESVISDLGLWKNGGAYRIANQVSREKIMRYVRADGASKSLGRITLGMNKNGALFAVGSLGWMAIIHFSFAKRVPIMLGRVQRHQEKKIRSTNLKTFSLHAEGCVLIPLLQIANRVINDWTVFADPTEYKSDKNGDRYITLKGWPEEGAGLDKEKKDLYP